MRILKQALVAYKIGAPYCVSMPKGSRVLSVHQQNDVPTLWFAVPDTDETETKIFHLLYTGHEFPSGKTTFLDTVHIYDGKIVIHVLEEDQN